MKNNKKGFIAMGMAFSILILVVLVFFFVKYQEKEVLIHSQNIDNIIEGDINNVREDIKEKSSRGKELTNFNLNSFGKETYDDGTVNDFNVLDTISDSLNIDKTQFIDRIMTSRRKELSFLGDKNTPDKINNTFKIDLTKFLRDDNTIVGTLNNLTFEYGTSLQNTPDTYILISRVKRNVNLNLNDEFEKNLTKSSFGVNRHLYGRGNDAIDLFSLDYKKITGKTSGVCNIEDKELKVKWCNRINFNDFLSNDSFDLDNYFYKIFLIFGNTSSSKDKVPFKLTSPDGNFGLGNFRYNDLTLLTSDNTKKRFIIESSAGGRDGGVLPYLMYSLWVSGEVKTDGE